VSPLGIVFSSHKRCGQPTVAGAFSGSASGFSPGSDGARRRGASGEGSTKRARASQVGSHQFQRPRLLTRAGTSRARTMVASRRMPTPSAVPRTLVSVPGDVAIAEKAKNRSGPLM
jgi:hypothetical protein